MFFEAMGSCAGNGMLRVRDLTRIALQPPQSLLGTCTTAFKMCPSGRWSVLSLSRGYVQARRYGCSEARHLGKDQLQFNYAFRQRGELRISLAGKVFYLTVGCKAGKVSPELAQIVVKKLFSR